MDRSRMASKGDSEVPGRRACRGAFHYVLRVVSWVQYPPRSPPRTLVERWPHKRGFVVNVKTDESHVGQPHSIRPDGSRDIRRNRLVRPDDRRASRQTFRLHTPTSIRSAVHSARWGLATSMPLGAWLPCHHLPFTRPIHQTTQATARWHHRRDLPAALRASGRVRRWQIESFQPRHVQRRPHSGLQECVLETSGGPRARIERGSDRGSSESTRRLARQR